MPVNHHSDIVFNFANRDLSGIAGMNAGWCVFTVLPVFSAWERRYPMRRWPQSLLRQSYKTNASLFVANNLLMSLIALPGLLALAEQYANPNLLGYLASPGRAILAFLLFDLSLYLWHWASHRYGWLWQFHRIHHSDTSMNVTTAFRLHFMDHVTMTFLKAAYILLFGFSREAVLLNEIINTLFLVFHHSNISFKGEQRFGRLIITPKLHRLHHSTERHEHDRNFGAVLSLWDRLSNTLAEAEPKRLGIKENIAQDWPGLILAGFTTAKPAQPAPLITPFALNAMIAEAAYYKAEKRNFKAGHELSDWLEAKKDIFKQFYGQLPAAERAKPRLNPPAKQGLCC